MKTPKLKKILGIIKSRMAEERIPIALIGAMALAAYGLPRYTSDIDLLTEIQYQHRIVLIFEGMGYTCFQKTDRFAQFDSDMGVLGNIDLMFVSTTDGKDILERCVLVSDDMAGDVPIIQPSDYIILKLMAIANTPDRRLQDEGDIVSVLKLYAQNKMPEYLGPLDQEKILHFAGIFREKNRIEKIFKDVFKKDRRLPAGVFVL